MAEELLLQLVEVTFIGAPPARQVDCALGVSEVSTLRYFARTVCGSFQPFLEALCGHEVISLKSIQSGV